MKKLLIRHFNTKTSFSILEVRDTLGQKLEPELPHKNVGFVAGHHKDWKLGYENLEWLMNELDRLCMENVIKIDERPGKRGFFTWVVKPKGR